MSYISYNVARVRSHCIDFASPAGLDAPRARILIEDLAKLCNFHDSVHLLLDLVINKHFGNIFQVTQTPDHALKHLFLFQLHIKTYKHINGRKNM